MVYIKGSKITFPLRKLISKLIDKKFNSIPEITKDNLDYYVSEYCKNAYENTQYFNEIYGKTGIPQTIQEFQENTPYMTKEMIESDTQRFFNNKLNSKKFLQTHTSGTSGNPLYIYRDKKLEVIKILRKDVKLLSTLGIKLDDHILFVASKGSTIMKVTTKYSCIYPNIVFSNKQGLFENQKELKKIKLAKTYTRLLLNFIKTNNFQENPFTNLEKIIVFGEKFTEKTRKEYNKFFKNVEVIDLFGCIEIGFVATSCEHGFLHPLDGLFIESKSHNDLGLEELVITDFNNYNPAQFVTRYATGDSINLNKNCDCKKGGISFSVNGRISDSEISKHLDKYNYDDMINDLFDHHNLSANLVGIIVKDLGHTVEITPEIVASEGYENKLKEKISPETIDKQFLTGNYPNLYIAEGVWQSGNPIILLEEPEWYVGKLKIKKE